MVRFGSALKLNSIFLCVFALALLSACTQKKATSQVSFKFPEHISSKAISQSVSAQSYNEDGWGLSDPTALADFDCYAIAVGADEPGLNQNYCQNSDGTAQLFKFGPMIGLFARGASGTVEVPSGSRRSIYIIGFDKLESATCERAAMQDLTSSYYSPPYVISQTTVDLAPGDVKVAMTLAFDANKKIGECEFNAPQSSSPQAMFMGSGADGNVTISGSFVNLATVSNQSATRFLTTASPVVDVLPMPADVTKIKIQPSLDQNHFGVGDEVMLYIHASRGTGCGGQMAAGDRMSGKVLVAPTGGNPNYVEVAFSDPSRANSLTGFGFPGVATNFCKASINRVPHLNNLEIGSGVTLSNSSLNGLGGSFESGGVLFMRIRGTLSLASGATASISMSSAGYRGGGATYPGESPNGVIASSSPLSNTSGGGGSDGISTYPGGGAGGGSGGGGFDGSVGWLTNFGSNIFGSNDLMGPIYMGGGGGSKAGNGGAGGGIIMIVANKVHIENGEHLKIAADGAHTFSNTEAGGGGGSILFRMLEVQVDAGGQLDFSARGGHSNNDVSATTSAAEKSGAGGGGRIHVEVAKTCVVAATDHSENADGGRSGPYYSTASPRLGATGTIWKMGSAIGQPTCGY